MLFFAALAGVIAGDMQVRNIGVAGNVGTFPVEAILLARLFWITEPHTPAACRTRAANAPREG
jgi:hypothetical protein